MRYLLFLFTFLISIPSLMAQDYSADYKAITAFAKEGKYRSALDRATELYNTAEADGDQDDMVKALAYRAAYTLSLEEEGTEETLRLLQLELSQNTNRPVVSPLLNYLIGQGYYTYAQQNSYRLRNATAVTTDSIPPAGTALEDWTLRQLADAADRHLYAAITEASRQRTQLSSVPAIVQDADQDAKGLVLYDLLVREIMGMLNNPLLVVNNSAPAAAPEWLLPAREFVNLDLSTLDAKTGPARRLNLHQRQLAYHLGTGGEGLMRADLDRVEYVRQLGAKEVDYLATLARMHETYGQVPGHDLLLIKQAEVYANNSVEGVERPKVEALKILDRVEEQLPEIQNSLASLRAQIRAQELTVTVQRVYQTGQNILLSNRYRNIGRVHHKLVRITAQQFDDIVIDRNINAKDAKKILAGNVVAEKSFRLPDNDDYDTHTTETWLPRQAPGAYVMVSSSGPNFDDGEDKVSLVVFQVSGLALLKFDDGEDEYYEVQNLQSGAPKPGVSVEIRVQQDRRNNTWKTLRTILTDDQGRFNVTGLNRMRAYMILRDGNDLLITDEEYFYDSDRRNRNREQAYTPLFTDRAIYRPGQTVHVYGITMIKDKNLMPRLLTGQSREVRLRDANYQEISQQSTSSDEFGRFDLSFVLPESGLTGNFRLETEGGTVSFRVEEYKRPKFEVTLEAPDYLVGGEAAEFSGKATLFAGPAVNDAQVSYRVFVEEQRYYWWYRRPAGGGDRELVTFGTAETDENGAFLVSFTPDKNLAARRGRFNYVVEVDVADATGETQTASASSGLRGEKPSVSLQVPESLQRGDTLTINASGAEESITIDYRISKVSKPDAGLRDRRWEFPDRPVLSTDEYEELFPQLPAKGSTPEGEWPVENQRVNGRELSLENGKGVDKLLLSNYPAGYYRIDWSYPDGAAGEPVVFSVSDLENEVLPEGTLYSIDRITEEIQPGQPIEFKLVAGQSLPHFTYSFMSRKGVVRETGSADRTSIISYTPTDADRGGIRFDIAFVYAGQLHESGFNLDFGWDNKELSVDYATFRDKLRPGAPETWTLTIRNADGSPVNAAALASMYDASLDQITPAQPWNLDLYPGIGRYRRFVEMKVSGTRSASSYPNAKEQDIREVAPLPSLDLSPLSWYNNNINIRGSRAAMRTSAPAGSIQEESMLAMDMVETESVKVAIPLPGAPKAEGKSIAQEEAAPVSIRKNLQETAFWLPELTTTDGGDLVVSFTSPEALTKWRFRVLTHDKQLNYGYSEKEILTQKELMVLPNVPRFLREGDALELTARVNNMTENDLKVRVVIEYFNPETNEIIADLGAAAGANNCIEEQIVGADSGKSFCFPLSIPDGYAGNGPIGYRVIARGGNFSDGEENVFPVLTDRTLITVSQAFYLKKKDSKEITIPLLANYNSTTLQHVGYTFEATTNPAWMALKALPYLMEYPYDCTEQVANRYFANQLAFATVSRKPVLETVFRKWQADSNALKSELEQNPTLKNALLTETPWLRAAQSETEQRARIANLFDLKTLADGQTKALDKLVQRQNGAGYFSWFPGGSENRYMTQYVVETLARLQQLNVVTPDQTDKVASITAKAIQYLDRKMADDYERLLKNTEDKSKLKDYRPGSHIVHYLYARALAGGGKVGDGEQAAYEFYSERVLATWTDYGLYEQALIASTGATLAKSSPAGAAVATKIIESLRERAIRKDEFGMYWKYGRGFTWNNLPIETHCRILEAFQLNGGTTEELDDMRLWLLTNKRTNRWPTTKSTAAAVFALLNTGTDWVANDGKAIKVDWPDADAGLQLQAQLDAAQSSAEAATGAFSISLPGAQVGKGLATVKVKNKANNLVWGGTFWQYTELASKVESSNDGPLTLDRELFHRVATEDGIRLDPITAEKPLSPGDRITVRLILRSDRDLDYVHVKDRRAATFEPVEQLSGYQYKNGLGFYFAPGDLATNFFIDQLPKGTYTIEYDLFATYTGSFSNGLGRVQCMYAPEFGANTSGAMIAVQ